MKISKVFANTLQSKTRLIFFFIAFAYNLLLGWYLKDFLVIAPTLLAFYLLSALPSLFLLIDIRSRTMKTIIFVSVGLIMLLNLAYVIMCRRVFAFPTLISLGIVVMYCVAFSKAPRKDRLLTKIYTLIIFVLILATLLTAYNFVFKSYTPYLANGGGTLWDTQTEDLADEICEVCETDEEKVQAIYQWIIHNFEYDYDYYPPIQFSDIRKTLSTKQGICFDFAHLFSALCRSQDIPCYMIEGDLRYSRGYGHAWNRVYFNGNWWNIDVTNDLCATKNNKKLYGFCKLENAASPDAEYVITRIY